MKDRKIRISILDTHSGSVIVKGRFSFRLDETMTFVTPEGRRYKVVRASHVRTDARHGMVQTCHAERIW